MHHQIPHGRLHQLPIKHLTYILLSERKWKEKKRKNQQPIKPQHKHKNTVPSQGPDVQLYPQVRKPSYLQSRQYTITQPSIGYLVPHGDKWILFIQVPRSTCIIIIIIITTCQIRATWGTSRHNLIIGNSSQRATLGKEEEGERERLHS